MAASQDPMDDRQHGHAIRRRQGGRTSIYHDQLYQSAATEKALLDPDTDWLDNLQVRGSDGSTGAY